MNYIVFKEMVKNQILNYLPVTYKDADVRIDEVYKTNEKKETLVIRSGEDTMVPVLYLDRWYQECHQGKEIQNVLQEMGAEYISAVQKSPFISGFDVDRANTQKQNGAVCIINNELMKQIAEKMGGDIIILPSSIHEVIIIRDEGSGYDGLKDMVKEINQSEVETEERLSNNIYRYDKKRKEFTVITEDIKRDRKATDLKGEKKSARRR